MSFIENPKTIQQAYQPWEKVVGQARKFNTSIDSAIVSPDQNYQEGYILLAQLMDRADHARLTIGGHELDYDELAKTSAYPLLLAISQSDMTREKYVAGAVQDGTLVSPDNYPSNLAPMLRGVTSYIPWAFNRYMYQAVIARRDRFLKLQDSFTAADYSPQAPARALATLIQLELESKQAMMHGVINTMPRYTKDSPIVYNADNESGLRIIKLVFLRKLITGNLAASKGNERSLNWDYHREFYGSEYWRGYHRLVADGIQELIQEAEMPSWAVKMIRDILFLKASAYDEDGFDISTIWTPVLTDINRGDRAEAISKLNSAVNNYPKLFKEGTRKKF